MGERRIDYSKYATVAVTPVEDRDLVEVYVGSLSEGSTRSVLGRLEKAARILSGGREGAREYDWASLRYERVAALRVVLAQEYAHSTANAVLSAVKGVANVAKRFRRMSRDDYWEITQIEPVRGSTVPPGRCLRKEEKRALHNACAADRGPSGLRDAAVLCVMMYGGLRREEVVTLDLRDWQGEEGLRVTGKGNKERLVYLPERARLCVDTWIKEARSFAPGPLFCPCGKGERGKVTVRGLSSQSIYEMLRRRGKQAGLESFSPHDLRRTFISDLLDAGADVSSVQRLAGHAKAETTMRYDRRPEDAKKEAVELLSVEVD